MLNVALTGNIAAGKSTVAELFRAGAPPSSTPISWCATRRRRAARSWSRSPSGSGADLIDAAGRLDRGALRRRVLADPTALADLNRLVHPEVRRRRRGAGGGGARSGRPHRGERHPPAVRGPDPAAFDAVVLVDAPAAVRRARLLAARGLDARRSRPHAGGAGAERPQARAEHFVIDNDGDRQALEQRARAVWTSSSRGPHARA